MHDDVNDMKTELLSALHDDELTGEEHARAEDLLEGSSDARELLGDFAELGESLRTLSRPAAPRELHSRVMDRVRGLRAATPARSAARPSRRAVRFGAAVAAALLLAVIVFPFRPGGAPVPQFAEHDAAPTLAAPDQPAGPALAMRTEGAATAEWSADRNIDAAPGPSVRPGEFDDALRERLVHAGDRLTPGEVLTMLARLEDQPVLVEYSVVDVSRTLGQVQVLLARNGIHPIREDHRRDALEGSRRGHVAIYVNAPREELANALYALDQLESVVAVDTGGADVAALKGSAAPAVAANAPASSAAAEADDPGGALHGDVLTHAGAPPPAYQYNVGLVPDEIVRQLVRQQVAGRDSGSRIARAQIDGSARSSPVGAADPNRVRALILLHGQE